MRQKKIDSKEMEKVRASFTHQNTTSAAELIPDTIDDGARCGTGNKEDI